MSSVTDIILTTAIEDGSGDDEREHPNVNRLNEWIQARYGVRDALRQVDGFGGGSKAMQCDVFIGTANYLDEDGLIDAFKAIPWGSPESAQLMLRRECDDQFVVHLPAGAADAIREIACRAWHAGNEACAWGEGLRGAESGPATFGEFWSEQQ